MKYKEIITLTRPDTLTPFFPEGSVHLPESENDFTSAASYKHYVENYVNTGKCDPSSPTLSDDGLTLTYTAIYLTADAIAELKNDVFYDESSVIDNSHQATHNIIVDSDIMPVAE
jgi:hypothetical protein